MEKLDWYRNGQVPYFTEYGKLNKPNKNGIFLVANKYGKVTYICYGNLERLYDEFNKKKFKFNSAKIEKYTYALFSNRDDELLKNLQRSFYHNPKYNEAFKLSDVPKFGIFSTIYKEFHTEIGTEKKIQEKFNEIVQISDLNYFSNKLEIKLTKLNQSDSYVIFFNTMSYFDIEFKIREKFKDVRHSKKFDENYEVIQEYGYIEDYAPELL